MSLKKIKFKKKYEETLENGQKIEIRMYIKAERPLVLRETLHFIGIRSRNFYLSVADWINNKPS